MTPRTARAPRAAQQQREAQAVPRQIGDGWLIASYLLPALALMFPALNLAVHMFGTDYLAGGFFSHEFVSDRISEGGLPGWNPFIYGGLPHFSNPGSTFYPPMLLLRLLLPTHAILPWLFLIHIFAAGAGAFLLLREHAARLAAAYLGGMSYMLSAFLLSSLYAGHDGRFIVAALTPLFLFAILRGVRTAGLRWFLLGGTILGFSLLSFQIQSNYYMLLAGAIVGVWALLSNRSRYEDARAWAARLGGGVLVVALGFSMAAVNFLPFLEYVEHSPRGEAEGRGYEYAVSWSMPPAEIAGLAYPDWKGMNVNPPGARQASRAYWGENPFKLHAEYIGAFALVGAILALLLARRERVVWLWLGIGIFAILVSFGGHTPVYRLFYELLPGIKRFRAPSIAFFLVVLSLNVIAAMAFSRVQEIVSRLCAPRPPADDTSRARQIVWVLGGMVGAALLIAIVAAAGAPETMADVPRRISENPQKAAAYMANYENFAAGAWRLVLFLAVVSGTIAAYVHGRIAGTAAVAILAVVVAVDLAQFGRRFVHTVDHPATYFRADDVIQALRPAQEEAERVWYLPGTDQTNYPTRFGIELLGGEHGNQLQRYNEFLGTDGTAYTDYRNVTRYPSFLAAANVRYLVSAQAIDLPFLDEVHRGSSFVYRNLSALPRAYVAYDFDVVDSEQTLARMQAPEWDPSELVVLEEDPGIEGVRRPPAAPLAIRHGPDEVVVEVETDQEGLLVLSDNHYPYWRAEIDGVEADVLRANHTFRAVVVPEGRSRVRFLFRPEPVTVGFFVTFGLLGLLFVYLIFLVLRTARGRSTRRG